MDRRSDDGLRDEARRRRTSGAAARTQAGGGERSCRRWPRWRRRWRRWWPRARRAAGRRRAERRVQPADGRGVGFGGKCFRRRRHRQRAHREVRQQGRLHQVVGLARHRAGDVRHRDRHCRRRAGECLRCRRRQQAHPGVRQQRHVQDADHGHRRADGALHDAGTESGPLQLEFKSAGGFRQRRRDLQAAARRHDRRQVRQSGQAAEGVRHGELHRLPQREQPPRRRAG